MRQDTVDAPPWPGIVISPVSGFLNSPSEERGVLQMAVMADCIPPSSFNTLPQQDRRGAVAILAQGGRSGSDDISRDR